MVFLCWNRPSPQQQEDCLSKSSAVNYDPKYKGATSKPLPSLKEDQQLSKDGFFLNHARVPLGSGLESFQKAKLALQHWRHFGLDWAFVDPNTPIGVGVKFCVCTKMFLPWIMMPLRVLYVQDSLHANNPTTTTTTASFSFASATLEGHLLAGEERFAVNMDENDQVWYEILSFSKPAHFLSFVGYPYVLFSQKHFAHQSTTAIVKHMNSK